MKLNATAEMMPVTWRRFKQIHPFAPVAAGAGLGRHVRDIEGWPTRSTASPGSDTAERRLAGRVRAGSFVIRAWHEARRRGIATFA